MFFGSALPEEGCFAFSTLFRVRQEDEISAAFGLQVHPTNAKPQEIYFFKIFQSLRGWTRSTAVQRLYIQQANAGRAHALAALVKGCEGIPLHRLGLVEICT
jgi:hypothetical protein